MKTVLVTTSWDDGHKLDMKLSKLLMKYAIKGTFYISPKNREFDQRDLLTEDQIKQIAKDFEIGAHTMTHPVLTKINQIEADKEIFSGKKYLENLINQPVVSFSYPKGKYNQLIKKMVEKSGFIGARTIKQYQFSFPEDQWAMATTIHAGKQYRNIFQAGKFSKWHLSSWWKLHDWEFAAKELFDQVYKSGGIYHLWGHSWIINQLHEWGKLARVLNYISDRSGVYYVENKQILERRRR